jgi:hypothetical protein
MSNQTKICCKCKNEKSIDSFSIDNSKKDKLSAYCKKCISTTTAENRRYYDRKYSLRDAGCTEVLTKQRYREMISAQNNKCGICEKEMSTHCIDHDHKTGKIRMLLCQQCNSLLGFAKDNIDILSKSIKYLEKFR